MSSDSLIPEDYGPLFTAIRERIRSAQYEALRAVNRQLVELYWDIGSLIVEQQREESWGRSVVEHLAKDLRAEFPGVGGFSSSNLWYMRKFYLTYREREKLQPLAGEIGWTHNQVILDRCKDDLEREFYLRMTRRMGWTRRVLVHQIENQTYEKTLLSQTSETGGTQTQVGNGAHRRSLRSVAAGLQAECELAPLVREIGWSHGPSSWNAFRDDLERDFYLRMTRRS